MYGEEFYENNLHSSKCDDMIGTNSRILGIDLNLDNDQRSKGKRNNAIIMWKSLSTFI